MIRVSYRHSSAPVTNYNGFLNSSSRGSNELYGISSIIEVEKKYIVFVNNSSGQAVKNR